MPTWSEYFLSSKPFEINGLPFPLNSCDWDSRQIKVMLVHSLNIEVNAFDFKNTIDKNSITYQLFKLTDLLMVFFWYLIYTW